MNAELPDFQALLAETGIEFWPTPDFVACPVRENSVFHYQYAARSPSGGLEMRYRIDAFARLEARAESEDVDMLVSVSLDKMYTANFMAIIHNLSGGQFVEPTVFKPESSTLLYNADWSALCFLRLAANSFAPGFDSAYVLAIHKDGVADVYVIGVYTASGGETGNFDKDKLPPDVQKYLVPTLRFT